MVAIGGGSGRRHALVEGQALGRPLLALDRTGGGTRLALRSEWETGRHFEPAHLLAPQRSARRRAVPSDTHVRTAAARRLQSALHRRGVTEPLPPWTTRRRAGSSKTSRRKPRGVSQMTTRTRRANHGLPDRDDAPDIFGRGDEVRGGTQPISMRPGRLCPGRRCRYVAQPSQLSFFNEAVRQACGLPTAPGA